MREGETTTTFGILKLARYLKETFEINLHSCEQNYEYLPLLSYSFESTAENVKNSFGNRPTNWKRNFPIFSGYFPSAVFDLRYDANTNGIRMWNASKLDQSWGHIFKMLDNWQENERERAKKKKSIFL